MLPRNVSYGSMGGIAYYNPGDTNRNISSGFTIEFNSTIEFGIDLTTSVDSVFAKLRIDEADTKSVIRDFTRPAAQLLSDRYNIILSIPDPVPNKNERKFIVSTEYSEWQVFQRNLLSSTSPFISFPIHDLIRVRAKVSNAEVTFNSYTPKKVFISARLLVEIQTRRYEIAAWQDVAISDNLLDSFKEQLRIDLKTAYYNYLIKRYGVEMKSSSIGTTYD